MVTARERIRARSLRARIAVAGGVVLIALVLGGCGHVPFVGSGPASPEKSSKGPSDVALLTRFAAEQPTAPYWPFRLGELSIAANQIEMAELHLKSALERDPSYEPALALLSKAYYDSARFEEGVILLEDARTRRSGILPAELATALALHYEALGRLEEAEQIAGGVEDRSIDWKRNGSALVYLRLRGDSFLDSPEIARKALDAEPSAVNFNNYGITQLYGGNPEGAKESFLKAHDLDPDLPGALYNLAIVDHFYFFDVDQAREWYRRYRRLSPEDPDRLEDVLASDSKQASAATQSKETP
jgi:tetratricopeptide (TPR) repeat protein